MVSIGHDLAQLHWILLLRVTLSPVSPEELNPVKTWLRIWTDLLAEFNDTNNHRLDFCCSFFVQMFYVQSEKKKIIMSF